MPCPALEAQSAANPPMDGAAPPQPAAQSEKPKEDDRIFGVMPNHLTINGDDAGPLTWKGKFAITAESAFDPYEFAIAGALAGVRQSDDSDAPFGQGAAGFAKRYASAFADQAIGNMMTGAVFPSLLRTDPRYYRLGKGSFGHRFKYTLSRIVITRTDSGHKVFNAPEFLGNVTAAGISNLYYPSQDRTFSNNAETFATQLAIDCFGNFLKEFWPDIHRHLKRNK